MVVNTFAVDIQHKDHHWMTSNEIARRIEMARNGRFKAMLDKMVEEGWLDCRECARPGRYPGWEYKLAPGMYREPAPRSIKFSAKGIQTEMRFE
jgi:rubrerythrin